MSPKRFNPPTASSSDEDEVETTIGDEGSSSSDEEVDVSSKTPAAMMKKKPVVVVAEKQVSDSESESEEETDSDSEPRKKDEAVTKSVKRVTQVKDSVVKDQDSKKVKTCEKSVAKRPRDETDKGDSTDGKKRAKKVSGEEEKKSGGGGEETKKTYFQRVWTEDDEIAVLQGLIDYKNDTGVNPYDDMNGVYNLVKDSVSFDVSKVQFMDKIRTLKKKYKNNLGKVKNVKEPTFVKLHDHKAFELSDFIWGANGMALESAVKSNAKSKKSRKSSKNVESVKLDLEDEVTVKGEVFDTFAKSSLVQSLGRFGVDELAAQQGLSRLASEDKKRFKELWKAMQVKEFELYSEKSGFLHEVVTKIAEAFGSNH